jgi:hypothetical protein
MYQKIMTQALSIAKIQHEIFNQNKLNEYFVDNVNPFYEQTNNCLILESYYDTPIAKIHTPLGYWTVTSRNTTNGNFDEVMRLNHELRKRIEYVMICPGYQKESGYYGPYWLVKSIDGVPVEHPNINLLPPSLNLDLTTWNRRSDADILEVKKKLAPYLKQLHQFYKKNDEYISYENGKKLFNELIKDWINDGILSDKANKIKANYDY